MASIVKEKHGRKRIDFTLPGRDVRQSLRLGRATMKQAEKVKVGIESLIDAGTFGAMDVETAKWLSDLDDTLRQKIESAGLVKPQAHGTTTLRQLLDAFFANLNVKPITSLGYQPTRTALTEYFGAETSVRAIEPLQADQWRAKMKADKLAEATISKRVKLARQMFRRGVRWKMLSDNPFADVRAGSQMNKSRQRFISAEDSKKVLDACPDSQWRLLFALSRYGGLRCPSEHLALTWADVDWDKKRFRVTCSKTEHHEGRGERWVPIFPELYPHLMEAFEQADEGARFVVTRYRNTNGNLRTQLQRIIKKAGVTAWPRLFHNLRATRQTELAELFPAHVVCSWIGNTERVAQDHYLQITDAHLTRAVQVPNVQPSNDAQRNPQQYPSETPRRVPKPPISQNPQPVNLQNVTPEYDLTLERGIAATGLEPATRGL